jgi:hypothetical protein
MKIWLVSALMVLLGAAHLQHDALSFAAAREAFRAEANADVLSLHEDTRGIRLQFYVAPVWVKSQWQETRASLEALRADVDADARLCGSALKRIASRISRAKPAKDE